MRQRQQLFNNECCGSAVARRETAVTLHMTDARSQISHPAIKYYFIHHRLRLLQSATNGCLEYLLAIFLLILTLYSLLFCYPTFFLVVLLKRLKLNLLNLCKSKCSIFLAQPIVQIFNFLRSKIDLNDNFLHFYIVLDYATVVLNLINKLVRFSNLFQNRLTLTNNKKIKNILTL